MAISHRRRPGRPRCEIPVADGGIASPPAGLSALRNIADGGIASP